MASLNRCQGKHRISRCLICILGAHYGTSEAHSLKQISLDASFLLTIEVFLLTVRLFCFWWGNRK